MGVEKVRKEKRMRGERKEMNILARNEGSGEGKI